MQQEQIPFSLDKTVGIVCENCGNHTFKEEYIIRKISRFIIQKSEDAIAPLNIFVCTNCGEPCRDAMIPEAAALLPRKDNTSPKQTATVIDLK